MERRVTPAEGPGLERFLTVAARLGVFYWLRGRSHRVEVGDASRLTSTLEASSVVSVCAAEVLLTPGFWLLTSYPSN